MGLARVFSQQFNTVRKRVPLGNRIVEVQSARAAATATIARHAKITTLIFNLQKPAAAKRTMGKSLVHSALPLGTTIAPVLGLSR